MTDALPIACTLGADEYPRRLAAMSAIGRDALIAVAREPRNARLSFAAGARVRDRLDAIVAAEAHCCAFLTMKLEDDQDAVVLTIDAPVGAELMLDELVGAFAAERVTA